MKNDIEYRKSVASDLIKKIQGNFWNYCRLTSPEFYQPHRFHLIELCDILNRLYWHLPMPDGKVYYKLMINIPPQMGKTRTLVKFAQWALGNNKKNRIILASYNDNVANDFSKYTRDGISELRNDDSYLVFSDIFPEVKLKFGTKASHKWALEGEFFNYLGTGVGGSVTSKGGTIRIIDDSIKGAIQALNDNYLESQWVWYSGTWLSRKDSTVEIPLDILNMTRWSLGDLCGKELAINADVWYVFKRKACLNEATKEMLCNDFLSYSQYSDLKQRVIPEIFEANYNQEPVEIKGVLYKEFKTYKELPLNEFGYSLFRGIYAYCDTADEGDSYLCCIVYGFYQNYVYIIDVYYTKEGMEITEPETAKFLNRNNVTTAKIESNNGGRGFARKVQDILNGMESRVRVTWFHQNKNKMARILSESAFIQNNVLFPENWADLWPEYFTHMKTFKKEGKNATTDGADATTGVAENHRGFGGVMEIRGVKR